METPREFGVVAGVDLKGGKVDADGSGVADGGGTAYLQFTNCCPDFALRFEAEVFGFVWEFCLVDDDERARLFVESEGFHVENVGVHCIPPKQSDTSTSLARPPEWSRVRVRGR